MAAWLTVYCGSAVGRVSPTELRAGIEAADYWTLAEGFGIDDDDVDPALDALHIESVSEAAADGCELRLSYRDRGSRPIEVHVWRDAARLAEERLEAVERLAPEPSGRRAAAIGSHLSGLNAVVALQLGFPQLEDMGIVFAFEVARWYASRFDGIINDPDDVWSRVENGALVEL